MSGILEQVGKIGSWVRRRAAAQLSIVFIFVPIALIALGLAGYGWWWRVVADEVRANTLAFQAGQRDLGRELTWDAFKIEGFPYRVESRLSTLHFTAPDRGAAFNSDRIVVHVQPLALNRVVFSLEGEQEFLYTKERLIDTKARADKALMSLVGVKGEQRVELDIERLTGKATIDEADFNFIVEAAQGGLNIADPDEQGLPRVELAARFVNIALRGLDLPLGPTIELFEIDAAAKLPAELTQASATALIAEWRRMGTPIELKKFEFEWGGISVAATGVFTIDVNTQPEGTFRLKLGNHPRILELLEARGWITRETHLAAKPVLDVLAFFSGDAKRRVSVPLKIKSGEIFLGPARVATLNPPSESAQLAPLPSAIPVSAAP